MRTELDDTLTQANYARIARNIKSDDSPVGIDATKAHVLILHKLIEMEKRLDRIEKALEGTGEER